MTDDAEKPPLIGRIVAIFEVVLCSDYLTQLAVGATLVAFGIHPKTPSGALSLRYIVLLSLLDTPLLIGLICVFIRTHNERIRDVLLGTRRIAKEVQLGIPLIFGALVVAVASVLVIRLFAPSLHNLEVNPLEDLLRRPRDAWIFAVVVVIAGGVREEVQRAFILHRFDEWLGGAYVGVVVWSIVFGFGHVLQGYDVALTTAVMGAFWAIVYVRRRSIIAPLVSHSGFNLLELAQYLAIK